MANEKIGIIGNGNVGSALQKGLDRAGHDVRATGKDPEKVREVAAWADAIVLAVPFTERENAFQEMGDACGGKLVVDVTNAVTADYQFAGSVQQSGAEQLQSDHAECNIVKAFNTVFAQNMPDGRTQGEPLSLLVAGDDGPSKRRVLGWGEALGYDAVDAGPLKNARWLEAMGYLNIQLGYDLENGTESGWRYVHPGVRTAESKGVPQAR